MPKGYRKSIKTWGFVPIKIQERAKKTSSLEKDNSKVLASSHLKNSKASPLILSLQSPFSTRGADKN